MLPFKKVVPASIAWNAKSKWATKAMVNLNESLEEIGEKVSLKSMPSLLVESLQLVYSYNNQLYP